MDIRGHAALVTGGGSGLGAATARMLATAGAKVAILDVNDKAAAEVAIDMNGIAIHCDVADSASTEAAIAKAAADHGPARSQFVGARAGSVKPPPPLNDSTPDLTAFGSNVRRMGDGYSIVNDRSASAPF